MRSIRKSIHRTLAVCLSMSMVFGHQLAVFAADSQPSHVMDVVLHDQGVLATRIVDLQGNPVAGESITIQFQGRTIAETTSDADGLAVVKGLRPGMHTIGTPMGTTACRFWTADTAPPAAVQIPAVVSDAEVVRGQLGGVFLPMIVYAGLSIGAMAVAIDADRDADKAKDKVNALTKRVEALENASP